jgi:hypothetical protein
MWTSSGFPSLNRVYSFIDSSKLVGNFLAVLNFNRLFLKHNRFICNELPVLLIIDRLLVADQGSGRTGQLVTDERTG